MPKVCTTCENTLPEESSKARKYCDECRKKRALEKARAYNNSPKAEISRNKYHRSIKYHNLKVRNKNKQLKEPGALDRYVDHILEQVENREEYEEERKKYWGY